MAQTPLNPGERSKVLNLRIVASMEEFLNEAAQERSITRSELVRGLLEDFKALTLGDDLQGEAA